MRLAPVSQFKQLSARRLAILLCLLLFAIVVFAAFSPPRSSAENLSVPRMLEAGLGTPVANRGSATQGSRSAARAYSVLGQPQVDEHTVALYHFDYPTGNQVIDATGRYTGTLNGNATVTTDGLYAGVLSLDGQPGSYVRIGNLGPMSQGTIEAFVDFANICEAGQLISSLISAGSEYGGNSTVMQLGAWTVFDIYVNGQRTRADSGINPCRYLTGADSVVTNWQSFQLPGVPPLPVWPYETWRFHHLAATWGPRGMEVWFDGVLYGVGYYLDSPPQNYAYWSCPQCYAASPFYPERNTNPVPAPQMTPGYPPGDYTGPLPSYDTFLIGCNSSGACFHGRIDEVRISDIQRTFSYTLVPTVTPVPTQTPVPLTGAYTVDTNTKALFHLDSVAPCMYGSCVLDEVTSQYSPNHGSLIPNGHFGPALASVGQEFSIEPLTLANYDKGTAEAWMRFDAGAWAQPIFTTGSTSLMFTAYGSSNPLALNVQADSQTHYLVTDIKPGDLVGCWHHIAATWGPRGEEVWLDGILRSASYSYTGGMSYSNGWRIGSDFHGTFMQGALDEVRISNIQRTFSPRALARLASSSSRSPAGLGALTFLPWISVAPPPPACPFGN